MYVHNILLLLASCALAAHLRAIIPTSNTLPNPSILPPSTTASLTTLFHVLTAHLRTDNIFDFHNVSAGSYLLDIRCSTHTFSPLRVDIRDGIQLENGQVGDVQAVEVFGTFRGNEWGNKGPAVEVKEQDDGLGRNVLAFEVNPLGTKEYLVERAGCEFVLMPTYFYLLTF